MTTLTVRNYAGIRGPGGNNEFVLRSGELLFVRGESGAGKSRLLRRIVDLDPERVGTIELDGTPVTRIDCMQLRRRVSYVPQTPFRPATTPRALLERVRGFRGNALRVVPWRQVEAWLETLDITPLLDRELSELSGGEAQRLALLAGLQVRPEVLLLDEPTSGLDAARALRVRELVDSERARGAAALWVSHSPEHASAKNTVWVKAC